MPNVPSLDNKFNTANQVLETIDATPVVETIVSVNAAILASASIPKLINPAFSPLLQDSTLVINQYGDIAATALAIGLSVATNSNIVDVAANIAAVVDTNVAIFAATADPTIFDTNVSVSINCPSIPFEKQKLNLQNKIESYEFNINTIQDFIRSCLPQMASIYGSANAVKEAF